MVRRIIHDKVDDWFNTNSEVAVRSFIQQDGSTRILSQIIEQFFISQSTIPGPLQSMLTALIKTELFNEQSPMLPFIENIVRSTIFSIGNDTNTSSIFNSAVFSSVNQLLPDVLKGVLNQGYEFRTALIPLTSHHQHSDEVFQFDQREVRDEEDLDDFPSPLFDNYDDAPFQTSLTTELVAPKQQVHKKKQQAKLKNTDYTRRKAWNFRGKLAKYAGYICIECIIKRKKFHECSFYGAGQSADKRGIWPCTRCTNENGFCTIMGLGSRSSSKDTKRIRGLPPIEEFLPEKVYVDSNGKVDITDSIIADHVKTRSDELKTHILKAIDIDLHDISAKDINSRVIEKLGTSFRISRRSLPPSVQSSTVSSPQSDPFSDVDTD